MFILAWQGKGFIVDTAQLPDSVLDLFMERAKEAIEAENAQYESHSR